ncbi:hypothetical protein [Streptomyces rapamycinicus]|uniref:Uncharacterized protein n=2 Tax=Streptomyces rapamycinicus TaxID=1226757 RepID=A0A0A0NSW2_STRRN|nr:hypothetical protein [Streptomyces rapamycinicus]AGP59458.1 hypothetical protein M271_40390 [Streptomyces rapamycinicus NRRL 5491]MBB4787213.1 hypothetical protein [Streptomyces rapamycinicus]RLV77350.1 hypothetical protein D3C57_103235 [Streptomyces rapamycinicus NRRL 5491]UTO67171.1 hypothetical protein LJB45_36005 [Streptomyces rapamycinicus]UTP35129.1 hypothetical protein LIV37_41155 [Streptomyces rapamycinicus NRRL 5491]
MFSAPASIPALLPHVVRAAENAHFTGMVVVLARTADARTLHWELTEDWTSLHDVTGQLLAVLCPDPERRLGDVHQLNLVSDSYVDEMASLYGLSVQPLCYVGDNFAWRFVDSLHSASETLVSGDFFAETPHTPKEHHAAWTEAVSRCAAYFEVPESWLPGVLFLDFIERTAVLVRWPEPERPDFSLYRLCKRIAGELGHSRRAAELRKEGKQLEREAERLGWEAKWLERDASGRENDGTKALEKFQAGLKDRLDTHMSPELHAHYEGLARHLEMVSAADPELVGNWRTRLAELLSSGTVDESIRHLLAMARHVRATHRQYDWRRLSTKVVKVLDATNEALGVGFHWSLRSEDPLASAIRLLADRKEKALAERDTKLQQLREVRDRLRDTRNRLDTVRGDLDRITSQIEAEDSIAAATQKAARRLMGATVTETHQGSGGLEGYRLLDIRPLPEAGPSQQAASKATNSANTISGGTCHSPTVQAGDISGGVHFHHPPLGASLHRIWQRLRRRSTGDEER